MEPTERSIPPDKITRVMPVAEIKRKDLSIKRLRSVCREKKPRNEIEPTTKAIKTRVVAAMTEKYLEENPVFIFMLITSSA
jgi:hypothetical protein